MKISISGPRFKDENHYMTQEGYPLGTTCWYVRAESDGYIKWCCADDIAGAVRKATEFVIGEINETINVPNR